MTFPMAEHDLPFISTDQMREVDRAMIEDFGIALMQMMENAGRCLAMVARSRFLDGDPRGRRVAVLAGRGGNGGGGLVAARRLHGWGANLDVRLASPANAFDGVPERQLETLRHMGVQVGEAGASGEIEADLVIDALIGYSLRDAPSGTAADLIEAANAARAPVLSLDAPSGVDTGSGTAYEPSVNATATVTLALPKTGLRSEEARRKVGELYLADISVPPALYARPPLGLDIGAIFARSDIVRVW